MYHLPVKSSLVDSGSDTTRKCSGGNNQPLYLKPRLLGPSISESLKPLKCNKHGYELNV